MYRGLRGEQTAQQLLLRGFARTRLFGSDFRGTTALEVSVTTFPFDDFVVLFAHGFGDEKENLQGRARVSQARGSCLKI